MMVIIIRKAGTFKEVKMIIIITITIIIAVKEIISDKEEEEIKEADINKNI